MRIDRHGAANAKTDAKTDAKGTSDHLGVCGALAVDLARGRR